MSELIQRLEDEFEQFVLKVKTSQAYRELNQRYQALTERDRLITNIVGTLVIAFLSYQLVIGPALGYLTDASRNYKKQFADYEWMVANEQETKERLANNQNSREGSLLSVASATAKNHEISFSRFEPIGDDRVRLWLEQVKFNDLVTWLAELESNQGVSATDISMDSSAPGFVSVRLTLQG